MSYLDDFKGAMQSLVNEMGGPVTYFHHSTGGLYDPSTGSYTDSVFTFNLTGVLIDLTLKRDGMQVATNTMIQDGDKMMYCVPSAGMLEATSPLGLVTENVASDRVQVGGTMWRVYNVKSTDPAGTGAIVYEFFLRR